MAETLISPGVLARENDTSFITQQPVVVGAAIIGPTVKGPVELPTVVTSYSDFVNTFGDILISDSDTYSYFTSIAAFNYFNNGGSSLLVARVASGSFTPATSTDITNNVIGAGGAFASVSFELSSSYTGSSASNPYYGIIKFTNPTNEGDINYFITPSYGTDSFDSVTKYLYVSMSFPPTNLDEFGTNIARAVNSSSLITSWTEVQNNELYPLLSASYDTSTNVITFISRTSGSALNDSVFRYGAKPGVSIYGQAPNTNYVSSSIMTGGSNGTTALTITFVLETLSEGVIMNSSSSLDSYGALANGSADNVRWQIVNPNTSTGTFGLLIRRGDDTTSNPTILETWNNLSLDPYSPNFITRVIGDYNYSYNSVTNQIELSGDYPNSSKYVRVSQVNTLTPNYFDSNGNPKPQYTASLPIAANGAFTGATGDVKANAAFYNNIVLASNTQGVSGDDYDNMINLLSNQDDYRFSSLFTPGLFNTLHASKISTIITNTQDRGDSIYVLDLVPYGSALATVTSQASTLDTSYAATYWPWVQTPDPATGKNVWVPASTMIPGVFAFNDRVSEPWFAPAGINRGGLGRVIRAEQKLPQSSRDTLYLNKVNPIATFPGTGIVVYGQKTLQTKASALDRVNVRRLLIALKSYISQVANNLVFEQNTIATRNQFLSLVNPYLESVQQRQGLYAFRVVMDETNNTPDVIDRNQLVGQIYLQPTRTAEFIYLDFNVTPTGATFA